MDRIFNIYSNTKKNKKLYVIIDIKLGKQNFCGFVVPCLLLVAGFVEEISLYISSLMSINNSSSSPNNSPLRIVIYNRLIMYST